MDFINVKEIKPGQKIELDGFVCVTTYGSLLFTTFQMPDYIVIAPARVEVTVPEGFNAVAGAVAALDAQADAIREEAERRIVPLRQKKAELLQISYAGNDILDPDHGS